VGQSGAANYTVLDGEGWIGLIMEETVCLRISQALDRRKSEAEVKVCAHRAILPTMVVPPRWGDGISFLHPFTIHERDGREYRQSPRIQTSRKSKSHPS
jgi:hypothetical protein